MVRPIINHMFSQAVLALALVLLGSSPAKANTPLTRAVVSSVRNQVRLLRKSQPTRQARIEDILVPGDGLVTSRKALAELRFNDGSLARMGEQAVFRFVPRTRSFDLTNGTVLMLIPPGQGKTQIRTPNATAGIRGSALIVRYDQKSNRTNIIALTNSNISASNSDSSSTQMLKAGQGVSFVDDELTEVYDIDLEALYQSPILEGLEMDRPDSQVGDDAIAKVREETLEGLQSQRELAAADWQDVTSEFQLSPIRIDELVANQLGRAFGSALPSAPLGTELLGESRNGRFPAAELGRDSSFAEGEYQNASSGSPPSIGPSLPPPATDIPLASPPAATPSPAEFPSVADVPNPAPEVIEPVGGSPAATFEPREILEPVLEPIIVEQSLPTQDDPILVEDPSLPSQEDAIIVEEPSLPVEEPIVIEELPLPSEESIIADDPTPQEDVLGDGLPDLGSPTEEIFADNETSTDEVISDGGDFPEDPPLIDEGDFAGLTPDNDPVGDGDSPTNVIDDGLINSDGLDAGGLGAEVSDLDVSDLDAGAELDTGGLDDGADLDTGGLDDGADLDTGGLGDGAELDTGGLDDGAELDTGGLDDSAELDTGGLDDGAELDTGGLDYSAELDTGGLDDGAELDTGGLGDGAELDTGGLGDGAELDTGGLGDGADLDTGGLDDGAELDTGGLDDGADLDTGGLDDGAELDTGGLDDGADLDTGGLGDGAELDTGGLDTEAGDNGSDVEPEGDGLIVKPNSIINPN